MRVLTPTFDYTPREQFLPFHNRPQRWACLVCHRRAGKTYSILADIVLKALRTKKTNARYAYIAPFRTQAKEIAWTYLKLLTEGMREGAPREAELRVKLFNGSWITLYGADNPDSLRGLYLDGAALDEYGDMKHSLLGEIILPTLLDRKGWLVLGGTIKGRNQFYDAIKRAEVDPSWFFLRMPASTSGIIPDEDLEVIKDQMSPEEYDQEFELNVDAALKGTYYAEIMNELQNSGQITRDTLYDPGQKVCVASDIGFSDSCVFWFWQTRPDGFAIIDYYEAAGKEVEHYLVMLAEKGYDYDEIWLPHDAKAKRLGSKRTTIEQFMNPADSCPTHYTEADRLKLRLVPRQAVQHGIDAVRMILRQCWFDENTTTKGIDSLRTYSRRWNENTKVFDDKPKHDDASHAADGFRYLALVAKGSKGQSAESHMNFRRGFGRMGDLKKPKVMLQYKDGRIMTTQTLDEFAPLKSTLSLGRARRI